MGAENEIDIETLVYSIARLERGNVMHMKLVRFAIDTLRKHYVFPVAYLDGVEQEMFQLLGGDRMKGKEVFVYLAFHGNGSLSEYMKAGIARDVGSRMRSLYTGSPLRRQATYCAMLPTRQDALRVEGAIHAHLAGIRTSGEWFNVYGLGPDAVTAYVDSLAEVAQAATGKTLQFRPFED